jgi:hypothetical protein
MKAIDGEVHHCRGKLEGDQFMIACLSGKWYAGFPDVEDVNCRELIRFCPYCGDPLIPWTTQQYEDYMRYGK